MRRVNSLILASGILLAPCTTSLLADAPDSDLLAAGQKKLKALKYTPVGVYSIGDDVGTVQLIDGKIVEAKNLVAILAGASLTNAKWDVRNGDVFFNVGKTSKVKVGDLELKPGEFALFKGKAFTKLEPPDADEQNAAAALRLAKEFLDKPAVAKRRLQEIVDKYPKSKAAEEARQLLAKLDK